MDMRASGLQLMGLQGLDFNLKQLLACSTGGQELGFLH